MPLRLWIMHVIFTFFGSMRLFRLHALRAGPLYSTVKWSWSRTFLSTDLTSLAQTEQFVALLYSLHCSRISRFMGILLVWCYLQMVAAARTWSKNFLAASFTTFTCSGSKYFPPLNFTQMQLPHGMWCWYSAMKDFDDDGSHESCLHNTLSNSA